MASMRRRSLCADQLPAPDSELPLRRGRACQGKEGLGWAPFARPAPSGTDGETLPSQHRRTQPGSGIGGIRGPCGCGTQRVPSGRGEAP